MQSQTPALIRYLGDVFLAFVVIMFVAGLGSILALTLSATGPRLLLPLFLGPTYLFFILAGAGVGYLVNRRRCSRAAPWMWVLPAIWSAYEGARDLSSGIHKGDSLLGYIWNTLILGNHELGMISQWVIGAPFVTSLAYSFGAWLALFRVRNPPNRPS